MPDEAPVRRFPNEVKPAGDEDAPVEPRRIIDPRVFIQAAPVAADGRSAPADARDPAVAGGGGRMPVVVEFPRLISSVEVARQAGAAGPLEVEAFGDEVRVHDPAVEGRPLLGKVCWADQRIWWNWSEDPSVDPKAAADRVAQALESVRLEVLLLDGQRSEVVFQRSAAQRAVAEGAAADAPAPVREEFVDAVPRLKRDPFLPEPKGGDILRSIDVIYRHRSRITGIKIIAPEAGSAPDGIELVEKSPTRIEIQSPGEPPQRVAWIEAQDDAVVLGWERLVIKGNADAIEGVQRLADEMVLQVSGPGGASWRLRVSEVLQKDAGTAFEPFRAGSAAPATVAASPGQPSQPPPPTPPTPPTPQDELRKAMRAAADAYQREADRYSREQFRQRQQAANARAKQRDQARQNRNAQQRHEEKHGWRDRYGNWHAPDGHMSRGTDDRLDGVSKASPNSPRGGFGNGVTSWATKIKAEVEAERLADPDRYKSELPLPAPLDRAEFAPAVREFVKKRRGSIPDARINAMLDSIAKRMAAVLAGLPAVPKP